MSEQRLVAQLERQIEALERELTRDKNLLAQQADTIFRQRHELRVFGSLLDTPKSAFGL